MARLLIVGGGRMGTALASGLVRAGRNPSSIVIIEKESRRREELATELPGVAVGSELLDTGGPQDLPDGAVLAVKPADAETACRGSAGQGVTRILSLMAGVPTRKIEAWAGASAAVMRAMPNTPALVGAGAAALAGGSLATVVDMDWAESILGSVGMVVRCDEADLDAVTGLSGSGPAYVFFLVEALAEAGVQAGLDPEISRRLARQTVVGAGRMLEDPDLEPADLRRQVTSPGGTTAAGIATLETRDFAGTIAEAVKAASNRSAELGEGAPGAPDAKN